MVQVCDEVQRVTRDAAMTVIGMPPLSRAAPSEMVTVWLQRNAAAEVTATLRGFVWEPFDHS